MCLSAFGQGGGPVLGAAREYPAAPAGFPGNANKLEKLKQTAAAEGIENVLVCDYLHGQDFQDALEASGCALVSLEKGATGLCVPSKTYCYMMQGIPLLAIMDECDIVRDIESGAGAWVRNGEADKLADAIRMLRDHPEQRAEMGKTCRRLYEKAYTVQAGTQKYITLFRELLGSRGKEGEEA